jgi:endonuclease IV
MPMRAFKVFAERIEIEKKWLPLICAELKKYNESTGQQAHAIQGMMNDLKKEIAALAKNEGEFINTMTHFFALSKDLQLEEAKRKALEEEEMKPGRHDDKF